MRKKKTSIAKPSVAPKIDMDLLRRANQNRRDGFYAIGSFMFEFSQLEFTIRAVLHDRLKLEEQFFDIVIGPYDFRMLCAVTMRVSCIRHPEKTETIEKLFKECQSLNDKRVHVAHGVWTDGIEGFSLRVFNRNKLEPSYVDYNMQDLIKLANTAQLLMQRVMGFQGQS